LSSQNDDYIIEGILVAGSLQGWQFSLQRNLLEANVLNIIPAYPFEGGVRNGPQWLILATTCHNYQSY
jgi:hypothetical protein